MVSEKLNSEGSGSQASEWDSLTIDYREFDPDAQKKIREELANVDDMFASGRIDAEKARRYKEEILNNFNANFEEGQAEQTAPAPESQPGMAGPQPVAAEAPELAKATDDGIAGQTFQVGPGLSLEAEFKRITGEDWPGVKYTAETSGADGDETDDGPIENWVIKERAQEDIPQSAEDKSKKPEWDDRLTDEQRLDLLERGIYEPEGPEYERALREFGLDPRPTKEEEASAAAEEELQRALERMQNRGDDEDPYAGETKNEGEDREKAENEQAEKDENEAREKAEHEEAEKAARIKELEEEKAKLEEEKALLEKGPLTAINADFTHDKRELAHDLAENALNEEVAKGKLIKRLWKGTLFKKYYEKKYTSEFMEGERTVDVEGEKLTVEDLLGRRKDSVIERFVLGATDDMRYIHEKIGKKRKDGTYDGEKLTEADKETTEGVRSAIEKFASAKIPEGGSLEDLKRDFANDIARLKAEARDQGKDADNLMIDNYLEVAIQARERVEHGIAMERVMEGFKVYNADVRDGIRTEAHRDNIDKATDWLEKHTGGLVPAQVIAGAVTIVAALTQTGARAVAGAAGGVFVSSAISGFKERNRITEDRARMLRDAANGLEYSGTATDGETPKTRRAKKIAKYEARIGGTLYDLQEASALADNIENALDSKQEGEGKSEAVLRAIAEARVRIDLSDSEQKDLISYSSADKRGDERLRLDRTVIEAEKALSPQDKERLAAIEAQIQKEIMGDVDEKDKDFRRKRAAMAVKKAGKTLAIGAATFVVSQEVMAAMDPGKIGLLEKTGIIKTDNRTDASETLLAGLAGPRVRTEVHTTTVDNISGDRQAEIQAYENAGYTKTETSPAWTEKREIIADIKPADSSSKVDVIYDGWANNGTTMPDGNELGIRLEGDQFITRMGGNSTINGRVIDYNSMAAAGKIKTYVTIGGAKFEVATKLDGAGQIVIGGKDGVLTTTTGETIRALGEHGEKAYKYIEVVLDNGVDANGVSHIIPLATEPGLDTFNGTIQQVTETIVEHPAVYSFTKDVITEIPRAVTTAGIAFAPETARTGLGATRARAEQAPDNPQDPGTGEQTPNGPTSPDNPQDPDAGGQTSDGETGTAPLTEQEQTGDSTPTNTTDTSENNPVDGADDEADPDEEPIINIDSINGPEMYTGERARRIIEEANTNIETPESQQFNDDMKKIIETSRDLIGGEESVKMLTDTSPMTIEAQKKYVKWWSGLSKEARRAVLGIVDQIESSDSKRAIKWGNSFRSWVALNRGLLEAE